jgi:preprotein translocase subunit SecA
MDYMRQGIFLRSYAQKNPKQEYKRESFELFSDMLDRVKQDVVKIMLTIRVGTAEDVAAAEAAPAVTNVQYNHADYDEALAAPSMGDDGGTAVAAPPFVRAGTKVGRNDPCPCGSGKKYKQCHGRLA